jgi:hypothetical protein
MTPDRKRYSFWMNATELEGLKAIKDLEGTTESEQIRQAIRDWLRKKGVRTKGQGKRADSRKPR